LNRAVSDSQTTAPGSSATCQYCSPADNCQQVTADELERFVVSHRAVRPSAGLRAGARRAGHAPLPVLSSSSVGVFEIR
jgi:hypothetical protein